MRLIDADALINRIVFHKDWSSDEKEAFEDVINEEPSVEPSAQPERKTGRWERHNTYYGDDVSGYVDPDWRCSECGWLANVNAWSMYDLTDFCPHCGADMRGEADG